MRTVLPPLLLAACGQPALDPIDAAGEATVCVTTEEVFSPEYGGYHFFGALQEDTTPAGDTVAVPCDQDADWWAVVRESSGELWSLGLGLGDGSVAPSATPYTDAQVGVSTREGSTAALMEDEHGVVAGVDTWSSWGDVPVDGGLSVTYGEAAGEAREHAGCAVLPLPLVFSTDDGEVSLGTGEEGELQQGDNTLVVRVLASWIVDNAAADPCPATYSARSFAIWRR